MFYVGSALIFFLQVLFLTCQVWVSPRPITGWEWGCGCAGNQITILSCLSARLVLHIHHQRLGELGFALGCNLALLSTQSEQIF